MVVEINPVKVAVVVTVYNPAVADLLGNIGSYLGQVDHVVVTDNSDDPALQQQIAQQLADYPSVVLNQLLRNVGIAAAQNIGLERARQLGCEFVIEMDQDSRLPADYVPRVVRQHARLTEQGLKVGGIGPLAVRKDSDEVYDGLSRTGEVIDVEYTLSSGFLVQISVADIVGPKNEQLFIDFVDWEWCWRSRACGYRIFIDTTLEISHMLGDGHLRLFGLNIGMPAPIRHYYQFRNFIYLLGQRVVPLKWKLKYGVITLAKLVLIPLVFDRKIKRLGYAFKGIKDALLGVYGKIGE